MFRVALSVLVAAQMAAYIAFGIVKGDSPAQKRGWTVVVTTYALCLVGIWM